MLASGIVDWPWWGYALAALAFTHVTIAAATIFLRRHQAHRALALQDRCRRAEASGIRQLADLSLCLRRYAGA